MAKVIALIGRTLKASAPDVLPILSLDAAKVHLNPHVLAACARWGIKLDIIPPKETYLLQPLDTHAFAQMKRFLRDRYQARVGREGRAALSVRSWVDVATNAVYCYLRSVPWSRAFDHNGFGSAQQLVSARVLTALEMTGPPDVASTRPSDAQLRLLWPRRSIVNASLLFETEARPFILRIRTTAAWRAQQAHRRARAAALERDASSLTARQEVGTTARAASEVHQGTSGATGLRIRTTAAWRAQQAHRRATAAALERNGSSASARQEVARSASEVHEGTSVATGAASSYSGAASSGYSGT